MTAETTIPRVSRLAIFLVGFSVGLFAWTAAEGQKLGLHQVMPESILRHEACVSVAISDMKYGLNRGYVCYKSVREELYQHGWSWNPDVLAKTGVPYPTNMTARDRLDYGLAQACNLPDPAAGGIDHLPVFAEDVGYTDFVKLGFTLFGIKLGSLYSAYFVVMGAGLALYLLAYRRDVAMLLLLLAFQVGFFFLVRAIPTMGTVPAQPDVRFQLGTVINGRFLGTLGLIPFFHLAGCLLTWPRASWWQVALATGQAALLGLALHFRGSVVWMFLTLFAMAAAPAGMWVWRNRRTMVSHPFSIAAGGRLLALRWPVVVVLLGLVGQKAFVKSHAHWLYHTDDGLPNHLVWHNALMGLQLHDDWKNQPINYGKDSDGLSWSAVDEFLVQEGIDKQHHVSALNGYYKPRLHDELCRRIYLGFAPGNPKYMAELFLWYKPRMIWRQFTNCWGWIKPGFSRTDGVCLLVAFGACVLLGVRTAPSGWRVPVGIAAVGFVGSLLPMFWAYAIYHVMGEFLLLTGMLAVAGVAGAVGAVTRVKLPTGVRVRLPGAAGRVGG
ncbi:MAG: hypothetical protein U0804_14895 [Gemmataceae bacterium]